MRLCYLMIFIVLIQIALYGCSAVREVGDPIGSTIGEVTDELGSEKKLGKGEDALTIHPEGDKKIKLEF